MSEHTREDVDNFWSVLAFIANALLFLLIGAELNPTRFFSTPSALPLLIIAGLTVVAVLLSRLIVVLMLPSVPPSWRIVIFWSGLRGALSLALALALPLDVPSHGALIASTYAVVFFTLLVQGFSLRFILRRLPALSK